MIIDSIYFEITNRCNLNCVDCYNASGRNTVTVELPPEVLLSAMTTLYNRFGTVKFDFSGGEPTLYRQLPQLLEQLCARKEPFSYLLPMESSETKRCTGCWRQTEGSAFNSALTAQTKRLTRKCAEPGILKP